MARQHQYSISSDDTNVCDEDRIKKLFHVCDSDGDGYIDSLDLLAVCRELNLENSLEDLMKELGADESGRISYKEFLLRRLALRPEIEAICTSSHHGTTESLAPDYLPTSSDNSLGEHSAGKCESWEFDSGARDLSPMPNTLQRLVEASGCSLTATNTANLLELANKLHLAALESLRGEIFELTTRLQTVTQERDVLKAQVAQTKNAVEQQYEERLTELHSVIAELSRKVDRQKSLIITEEDDELTESGHSIESFSKTDDKGSEPPSFPMIHKLEEAEKQGLQPGPVEPPVAKVAERVRIHKMERHDTGSDLTDTRINKMDRKEAVEKPLSPLHNNYKFHEMSTWDDRRLQIEIACLNSQLSHSQSEVSLLQSVLEETKSYCERLYLLVGKYESNVIASSLALSLSDQVIKAYDLLVSSIDARSSTHKKSEEEEVRKLIADLKAQKNQIKNTIVELESFTENISVQHQASQHSNQFKPDLEIAVLMQELMAMKELKTGLQAKVYFLEREKENQELLVSKLQSQHQGNLATIQYLQSRLEVLNLEV